MNTLRRDTTAIGLPDDSMAPESQAAGDVQVGRIEVQTVAIGRNPRAGYEQLFLEYGRFRGWIYTAVKDIMPSDQLGVDGVDFDRYDDYSAHLAAIEIVATDGV
ncbi:MAG: hypothetical protein GY926_23795, partial [bacterium]|nr:hypothetical protein [bacterium]